MASARFAWGIDVGNRALKAVKLVRDGDQIRVDDFELIEHEHVLSNSGDNREEFIRSALTNFVQRHPMKGGVAAVGVAGQASFARFIKLPPVEEKKIPEIVRFEAIQQIPFPLDEVEWSYQLFRSEATPDVEVGIFAMRKELIAKHISYFTDVDLNVQVVQTNPLAVYNAMTFDHKLDKGTTMVVDLGAENTDLIICDNDSVWMRSIPIGGNNFTETLVKAFKLSFAKAEDLKRNAATSKYARQIFQAMRPVFADLVAEIQRSLGYYASARKEGRITKIVALGGTFRLPGLQKYLQQNLTLDVERIDTFAAGAPSDPKQAATFNENILSVVSAYGLALQALGEGKITSSLLPESIKREKLWKEKRPIFAAAAACFVVGSALAFGSYWVQNLQYEGQQSKREDIKRVQDLASKADNDWSAIESAGTPDRKLMSNVLGLMQYRDLWRHLLGAIGNALPTPQPEVVEGLKKNDPELVKKVPRAERNQIVIESITSRYMPAIAGALSASEQDLSTMAAQINSSTSNGGGGSTFAMPNAPATPEGGDPNAAASAEGARGYILVMRGTSPKANDDVFQTKLCAALKSIVPTAKNPKVEFAIKRATVVSANKIRDNPIRLSALTQQYTELLNTQRSANNGGGGVFAGAPAPPSPEAGGFSTPLPGGQPAAAAAAQPDDSAAFKDRFTNEDVRDDWEFTVLVVVSIDPPKFDPALQPATEPAPTAAQASVTP